MSVFWKQAACLHETTTQPNELGDALCADCGALVRVTLTRAALLDTFDLIKRDHGPYGRHSRRCVELEAGDYLCADDCQMGR